MSMSAHTQQSSAPAPAQNPPPLTTDVVYSSSSPFTQELLLSLTSGHFGEQVVMSNAAETARMLLASSGVDTFVQSPDNRSTGKRAAPTEAQPAKRRRNPSEQQQQQEQPQPQLQQAAIISELLAAAPQIASAGGQQRDKALCAACDCAAREAKRTRILTLARATSYEQTGKAAHQSWPLWSKCKLQMQACM